MRILKTSTIAAVALAANSASAAVTTFTDLASWSAAVSGPVVTEDFNSFTSDVPALFDAGDFSLTAIGSFAADNGIEAFDPNPTDIQSLGQDRNIDGTTYYSGDVDDTIVRVAFDFGIRAIAWDQTSTANGVSISFGGMTANLGSGGFFGLISDTAFSGFTLSGSDGAFGLDNFRYVAATPVPVPAALPLLALGLAGLGIAGRRRRG